MLNMRALWLVLLAWLLIIPPYSSNPVRAAQGRQFALVIGIGKSYQSPVFKTLQYPEEDTARMAERLQKLGFTVVDQVIGEKATKAGIQQAIDALGKAADNPNDLVILYYSGHGTLIRGGDGALRPGLVPQDAAPGSKLSFITDTELGNWLNTALGTKQVVLILDSCYSAGIGAAEKRLPLLNK